MAHMEANSLRAASDGTIAFDIVSPKASFIISPTCDFALDGYGEWRAADANISGLPMFFCSTDHWAAEHACVYVIGREGQEAFSSGRLYCFQGRDRGQFLDVREVEPDRVAHDGRICMGQTCFGADFFAEMDCVGAIAAHGEEVLVYFTIGD